MNPNEKQNKKRRRKTTMDPWLLWKRLLHYLYSPVQNCLQNNKMIDPINRKDNKFSNKENLKVK